MTPYTLIAWSLVIGLVSFRLWRLAAVDSITYPIHSRLRASTHPFVQWIDTLWSCPWCLGFWINVLVTAAVATDDEHAWWGAVAPEARIDGFIPAVLVIFAASTVTGLTASIDERLHT